MNDPSVTSFEKALSAYTGAPYAIALKRCCIALKGCCEYLRSIETNGRKERVVYLPKFTYEFVPQVLVRSGLTVEFHELDWNGGYQLWPFPVWDYARRFRPDMYARGQYQCLSFHRSKILGHTEGGAVLTDDIEAKWWLHQWRDDGRWRSSGPKRSMIGESGLMYPDIARNLELKLHWRKTFYDVHFGPHPDLPKSDYPDLSLTDWNGIWREQQKRF